MWCGRRKTRRGEKRKARIFSTLYTPIYIWKGRVHIGTLVDDQGRMRKVKVRKFYSSFKIVNNLLYWSSK